MTTEGNPLGLLGAQWWVRKEEERGKHRAKRKQLPVEEKENVRWLQMLERSTDGLPAETTALTVADREADIFEFLHRAQERGQLVLIRTRGDHRLATADEAAHQWAAAEQADPWGIVDVHVPRQHNRPEHEARLALRVAEVSIAPPRHLASRHRNCSGPRAGRVGGRRVGRGAGAV